jgi:hypothetical protein
VLFRSPAVNKKNYAKQSVSVAQTLTKIRIGYTDTVLVHDGYLPDNGDHKHDYKICSLLFNIIQESKK